MNALEFVQALAVAHNDAAAGAERANRAVSESIELAGRFAEAVKRIPAGNEGDQGGNAGPATTGRRSGIARDSVDGTSSRTIQGPNGLEVEILDPSGKVLSVEPVGPQRDPVTGPFGGGGASAPPQTAALGGGAGTSATAAPSGGTQALPGAFPSSLKPITGTAGGKTVVAPLEVLRQYCKLTEFKVPDSSVIGSSPTKGPWVRRSVWTCPVVPLILPQGGEFVDEEPLPGGFGFGGFASPTGAGTAASTNAPKGGADFGQHVAGAASGRDASGNAVFGSSTAAPAPPAAPSPGDKLVTGAMAKLTSTLDQLAKTIGRDNGNLSFRSQGFGG